MGMTHAILSAQIAAAQLEQLLPANCIGSKLTINRINNSIRQIRFMTNGAHFLVRGVGRSPLLGSVLGASLFNCIEEQMQFRLQKLVPFSR
jgi:hypothetical protein